MHDSQNNTFFREDTMLGVCEALGQDFGFNAQYLRVALAVLLFFNPIAVIGAYCAAAVVVLVSRLAVPQKPYSWFRRKAVAAAPLQTDAAAAPAAPARAEHHAEPERVLVAA